MKICPQCGKGFDESWEMCLECNKVLVDDSSPDYVKPVLEGPRDGGIEQLKNISELVVAQKIQLEKFFPKNKYVVRNIDGLKLFYVEEESSFSSRMFGNTSRAFSLHILNPQGDIVLKLVRPFAFFLHEMSVFDSDDRLLGTVKEKFNLFQRMFSVIDQDGKEIYTVSAPIHHPWTFKISRDDMEVGKILKKWGGARTEWMTKADNFNISFPYDATVDEKGILLGALFLIDMRYFENSR